MIQTNLLSVVQAYRGLPSDLKSAYLKHHSITLSDDELNVLSTMVDELESIYGDVDIFDLFSISYSIPQIGKEFDLLRFSKKVVINIEIKKTSTLEKIKIQLLRNKYYLSFLEKKLFQISFIEDTRKFYQLNTGDELVEITPTTLVEKLEIHKAYEVFDINTYFEPSNYLVSPFNSTIKFLEGQYFLTQNQELIKKNIRSKIDTSETRFVSVTGEAGTGKTLLTYDIAKEFLKEGKRVLVIHCANINQGQAYLNENGWEIIAAKDSGRMDFSIYDLVVIDEAQRMYRNQLNFAIQKIKEFSKKCLFSYDQDQCLTDSEINRKNEIYIRDTLNPKVYELTRTIRTNKQIDMFIRALLNKHIDPFKIQRGNIKLKYFKKYKDAKFYIESLCNKGWEMINYTPDSKLHYNYEKFSYHNSNNAHGVIGQEFDRVIAVIDFHFEYEHGKLTIKGYTKKPHYNPLKMLKQIMTRTRGQLYVIIINNNDVLDRTLQILN